MEFDEIFQYIGEFKLYQILLYGLLGIISYIAGYQAIAITFLGGKQEHWCKIERLEQFPFEQQKYVAIPYDEDSKEYSSCEYYDLEYKNMTNEEILAWNWTVINDTVPTLECEGWVYDKSEFVDTIVNQYGLVCDKSYQVALLNTLYMVGLLIAGPISGILGDRFGRKIVLLGGSGSLFIVSLAGTYAPNYVTFALIRLLISCSQSIAYLASFVMIMEIIGPRYRAVAGIINMIWFSIGFMTLPGMAYFVRDHKNLQLVMAIPVIITVSYIFLVPESPRWLITQKRYSEAEEILHNIAEINNRQLPQNLDFTPAEKTSETPQEKGKFTDLFTHPVLCREIIVIYLGWLTNSLVYYGLSLNTGALVGSVFLNTFISGFVEVPANIACIASMYLLGRKPTMIWAFLLAGISSFLCVPLLGNEELSWLVTTFAMIGKAAITVTFSAIYVYTVELFPTPVRHLALGSSSMMSRVGGLVAPFMGESLMNVWLPMPSVIFGVMGVLTGAAMFLLPETLNRKMPDTIAEAEDIGRLVKKGNISSVGKEDKTVNPGTEHNRVINHGYADNELAWTTHL